MGNYNDVLMEQLADQGDGSYAYVDALDEARRVFVEDLDRHPETVGADAKAQVEFDPAVVARYRLLGYENRDIADARLPQRHRRRRRDRRRPRGDRLYEVKLTERPAAGQLDPAIP